MSIPGGVERVLRDGRVAGEIVRYGAVVACGYVLAIVLYAVELDIGVPAYTALGVAFVVNALFNFSLFRLWVFPASGRSLGSDLARFCVAAALSAVVNYASFAVLYSAIGMRATLAQRLAILIAAPVTFLANRLWSFRASSSEPSVLPLSRSRVAGRARRVDIEISAGGDVHRRSADHIPDQCHEQEIGA